VESVGECFVLLAVAVAVVKVAVVVAEAAHEKRIKDTDNFTTVVFVP
jgi:hypothetical protein